MIVRKRSIDTDQHTTGYLVGNQWRTRKEAVKLAKKGKIEGVRVGTKGHIEYITCLNGYPRLYDLPEVVRS